MKTKASIIDQIIQNRLLSHVLFWITFLFSFSILAGLDTGEFRVYFIKNFGLLPAQLLATYSLAYYLIPQFFLKKKYLEFGLLLLSSIYFFSVLARFMIIYLVEPFIRVDFEQESLLEILSDPVYLLSVYFPAVYLITFLFYMVKNIKEWFEEKHQMEVLLREKSANELKFLKAQIHPHFLFNTLNNLYSLTLESSPKAPEIVIKLSEMLDYMLYQCGDEKVAISKEVALIQNYIDLESLRYGDKLKLAFNIKIDQPGTEIAPLVLLSIVENAFKHGVSGSIHKPLVDIDLSVNGNMLKFKVLNTKPSLISQSDKKAGKGIGSENIKRQLDLIYTNKYNLTIEDKPETYSLLLEIELA